MIELDMVYVSCFGDFLSKQNILFRLNIVYRLTAHGLATDHAKQHASPRSRVVDYPAYNLNFHCCPATTQPWED